MNVGKTLQVVLLVCVCLSNEVLYSSEQLRGETECPDISMTPPPVLDQGSSSFCAGAVTASLLHHHIRCESPGMKDEDFSVSILDVIESSKIEGIKERGDLLLSGTAPYVLLEGLQKERVSQIASHEQEPLRLFETVEFNRWLSRASGHLTARLEAKQVQDSVVREGVRFSYEPGHGSQPDQIHASTNRSRLSERWRSQLAGNESDSPTAKLKVRPFSVQSTFLRNLEVDEGNVYQRELVHQLSFQSPVAVDLCVGPMLAVMQGDSNVDLAIQKEPCRNHSMLAYGIFKRDDGVCMVRLQNSWGSNWNGDGRVDIPVETLFKLSREIGTPALTRIQREDAYTDSVQQQFVESGGRVERYLGQTAAGKAHGEGTRVVLGGGGQLSGRFENGFFKGGSLQSYRFSNGSVGTGEAEVVGTRIQISRGSLRFPNGGVLVGEWSAEGYFSGQSQNAPWQHESTFTGEMRRGMPFNGTVEGFFHSPTGDYLRLVFKDGEVIQATADE